MMLKILLAEDHNIVRNGIKMLLETESSIHVVGEMTNGLEVIEYFDQGGSADIVLADINMPELDGISMAKELKAKYPEVKVVMLSMHDNEKYISQAFIEGAVGYLLKNISAEELVFSLKHIDTGKKYICAELAVNMLTKLISNGILEQDATFSEADFSSREIEVLRYLSDGKKNNEIAKILNLNEKTISTYKLRLLNKLNVTNLVDLVNKAKTLDIV